MKLETVKLQRLTICSCGFGVLHDDIKIGAEYRIDRSTLRHDFQYTCGGCGKEQRVSVVNASCIINPNAPLRPFPADLFLLAQ